MKLFKSCSKPFTFESYGAFAPHFSVVLCKEKSLYLETSRIQRSTNGYTMVSVHDSETPRHQRVVAIFRRLSSLFLKSSFYSKMSLGWIRTMTLYRLRFKTAISFFKLDKKPIHNHNAVGGPESRVRSVL